MRHFLAVAIWCASAVAVLAEEPTRAPTPAPTPTIGPLQFQEVVTVEGATKDRLFDAALTWFPAVFKSGKEVLQIQNKEAGLLVGTGIEPYTYLRRIAFSVFPLEAKIRYHVTIEVKDGRYRLTVEGFTHEPIQVGRTHNPPFGLLTTRDGPPSESGRGLWESDRSKAWIEMKHAAAAVFTDLAKTLKARLATAATEKPW